MTEDYYKILGVTKSAAAGEIKSAYRKLAKQYHPDKNPGDKAAEEKFKKISEAYAVLSDPEKKKKYDMFGSEKFHQQYSTDDIFRGTNLNDILREFGLGDIFGRGFGGFRTGGGFEDIFGGRYEAPPPDLDLNSRMSISLEEAVKGGTRQITLQMERGNKAISVKIPPGIAEGGKLRLPGKGKKFGGREGDLYIEIHIEPHPYIQRSGDDLIVHAETTLTTALLGGSIEVYTLEGPRTVKIPAGTQAGQKIRIKGQGVKHLRGGGAGDLYIEIGVRLPKNLTPEQKKLIEELKETGI